MKVRRNIFIACLIIQGYFIVTYLYAYMSSSTFSEHQSTFSKLWPSFTNPYEVHLLLSALSLILIGILIYRLTKNDSVTLKVFLAFETLFALFLIPGLL